MDQSKIIDTFDTYHIPSKFHVRWTSITTYLSEDVDRWSTPAIHSDQHRNRRFLWDVHMYNSITSSPPWSSKWSGEALLKIRRSAMIQFRRGRAPKRRSTSSTTVYAMEKSHWSTVTDDSVTDLLPPKHRGICAGPVYGPIRCGIFFRRNLWHMAAVFPSVANTVNWCYHFVCHEPLPFCLWRHLPCDIHFFHRGSAQWEGGRWTIHNVPRRLLSVTGLFHRGHGDDVICS